MTHLTSTLNQDLLTTIPKLSHTQQFFTSHSVSGHRQTLHQFQPNQRSLEYKIVGQILLDHPLSYALTATADVPAVYLQQFWKTVRKVPDTKDTILFKLDSQEIIYTVDMFRDTLQLPVETPDNPFVAPVNIETMFKVFNHCLTIRTSGHDQTKINILQLFHVVVNRTNADYAAILWWDFINCVFQKKDVIQYPRFTKIIIVDLMKKFLSIPLRLEKDYLSIKDDIPLVSVYFTGNETVRGMLIPDAFLTKEICATNDYKEYETVFVNVVVPMNQLQPVVSTQGMHSSPQKSLKVTIKQKQVVEGKKDKESYADKFVASMIHNDDDDSGTRIEAESHKENPEVVVDDDVNDKHKQDESKDDNVEKIDDAAEEKDNDDQTDHTLVRIHATGMYPVIRQLAYAAVPDSLDEYLQIGEKTSRDCLMYFCNGVIELYGEEYLRRPMQTDVEKLYAFHQNKHGFPGTIGSINCTKWLWAQCLQAYRAQFSRGDSGSEPFILLEAVASQDLWIWHAFFGVAGLNNDVNVLSQSPILNDLKVGKASEHGGCFLPVGSDNMIFPLAASDSISLAAAIVLQHK
ncbi:retrovirus-related pol polyprotein from transposon TNT 1-94 [Tanacetum coccineum]